MNRELNCKEIFNIITKTHLFRYVKIVVDFLIKTQHSFYFVGGTLRDAILHYLHNREFSPQDIDLVVETKNYDLFVQQISNIELLKIASIKKYPQFLTISLFIQDEKQIRLDLSLPRREYYSSSGALPKVEIGSISEDLFRRDFTINAIALRYDVGKNTYYFFDPFYGIRDIFEKKIRILHKKSFIDDPTRILRAIRFHAYLGFDIEQETEIYLREAIKKNVFLNISKTRLANEFLHILRKAENLNVISESFIKYNIGEYYKFIQKMLDNFIIFSDKIELKKENSYERYYMRLFYLLEKTCGEVGIFDKDKIVKFKKYMVELNIPHKDREVIYKAVKIFSLEYCPKIIPSWIKRYSLIFNKKIPQKTVSVKKLISLGIPTKDVKNVLKYIIYSNIKKLTKAKIYEILKKLKQK